jgi:hypothetical protein
VAASTLANVAIALAFIAVALILPVINALKGKWWFALFAGIAVVSGLGLILGIVGAIRLAKPHSYWARHWYGEQKKAQTMQRFRGEGGRFPGSAPSEAELAAAAAMRPQADELPANPQDSEPQDLAEQDKLTQDA